MRPKTTYIIFKFCKQVDLGDPNSMGRP